MEEMLSDTEDNQPIDSPPRRIRRSTFFVRRDSIVPPPETVNDDEHMDKQEDDEEYLKRYYDQLYHEKEEWKRETNNRKFKYHDLKQQFHLIASAPTSSRISYSSLTDADIEFLKNKVNISKLIENQSKLHQSTQDVIALSKRLNELDQVTMDHIQGIIHRITEHILDNSSLD